MKYIIAISAVSFFAVPFIMEAVVVLTEVAETLSNVNLLIGG